MLPSCWFTAVQAGRRRNAAGEGLGDQRGERDRVERLRQVSERAKCLRAGRVCRAGIRAQEQQRHRPGPLVAPQLGGELEPVEAGHPHVAHHEVGRVGERALEAAASVFRLDHLEPFSREVQRIEHPQRCVVLDDEHARPGRHRQSCTGIQRETR